MEEVLRHRGIGRLLTAMLELSSARRLEDIQLIVRQAARELTAADGATFVLRDGENCYYADEDAIQPLWKGSRFPLSACVSGWVMMNKQSLVIPDIYADPRIPQDLYRPTFVRSLTMVPIRAHDPVGAIGNYWSDSHTPTQEEIRLLETLAGSTAIAIENVRLYGELQQRVEEKSAALYRAELAGVAAAKEMEERQRAESALASVQQQLFQAQKMEAVGKLAGGIAHDFNNVLSVILSYGEFLLEDIPQGDAMHEGMQEIVNAGRRAAALTTQMLAFSRDQILEPKVVNLNDVLVGVRKMLARLLSDDIELKFKLAASVHTVLADPGQVEQVVMNLVVNARDALANGGIITVETNNTLLEGEYTQEHLGVAPGEYVVITVADNGLGMDQETQARIFEPFFTTKPAGRGTGLGLATVYGIVKQSGGHIWVYSEQGKGTVFRVYFPRTRATITRTDLASVVDSFEGVETVLLVEDDPQVRSAAKSMLSRSGYQVLECQNGGEALLVCEQHEAKIDLLIADVVMPKMNGPQLVKRLLEIRPEMKALCMSGYTDDVISQHGMLEEGVAFIQKPLTPKAFLTKVRQVLNS